jgi:hypothetical protein
MWNQLRRWVVWAVDMAEVAQFRLRATTLPPPHGIKARTVLAYARRYGTKTFVETGTCRGAMVSKNAGAFDRMFTIELDPTLARLAASRLAEFPHVQLLQGDSGRLLRQVLSNRHGPCLFWLDAHWSGGDTAKGDSETPLVEELRAIVEHGDAGHVVLIDDARMFGTGDYPTQREIESILFPMNADARSSVAEDMHRFEPKAAR